jgi:argininosuccinate lyase
MENLEQAKLNLLNQFVRKLEKLIASYEAELRQKKMEMKKLFKHGKISEKEYKSVIEQLREMELKIHRTKFDFYRQLEEEYEIDLEGIKHLLLGE